MMLVGSPIGAKYERKEKDLASYRTDVDYLSRIKTSRIDVIAEQAIAGQRKDPLVKARQILWDNELTASIIGQKIEEKNRRLPEAQKGEAPDKNQDYHADLVRQSYGWSSRFDLKFLQQAKAFDRYDPLQKDAPQKKGK